MRDDRQAFYSAIITQWPYVSTSWMDTLDEITRELHPEDLRSLRYEVLTNNENLPPLASIRLIVARLQRRRDTLEGKTAPPPPPKQPEDLTKVRCPDCDLEEFYMKMGYHLSEEHGWSVQAVARWLADVESVRGEE